MGSWCSGCGHKECTEDDFGKYIGDDFHTIEEGPHQGERLCDLCWAIYMPQLHAAQNHIFENLIKQRRKL